MKNSINRGRLAVIGAGVAGRCVVIEAERRGWNVDLFESGDAINFESCSLTAAGMIAPFCEMEYAEPMIAELGKRSLQLWAEINDSLNQKLFFEQKGSIVVAHQQDLAQIHRLENSLKYHNYSEKYRELNRKELTEIEPFLNNQFSKSLFFPEEGQVCPESFFKAFNEEMAERVNFHFNTSVIKIEQNLIKTVDKDYHFDHIIDCRGLEARSQTQQLRGVRGEVIHIECKDIEIQHPIRLMHPRYPIYIVPRPDHRFIIGASSLECEDFSPISVRSTLELLSAVYSLSSAFSESRIIDTRTNCRPAYRNNLPRITRKGNITEINGLYRHGYLLSPALAELTINLLNNDNFEETFNDILRNL